MSSYPSSVLRYLKATRGDLRIYPYNESHRKKFKDIKKLGFPGFEIPCDVIFVNSWAKRFEYRFREGNYYIIADARLNAAISELDLLANNERIHPDIAYMKIQQLMADEFRSLDQMGYYHFIYSKLTRDAFYLEQLSKGAASTPIANTSPIVMLAHEIGHILFAIEPEKISDIREFALAGIKRFINFIHDDYQSIKYDAKWRNVAGVPLDSVDEELLQQNIFKYVEHIENNDALIEELTCDLVAAFAYINIVGKVNMFAGVHPQAFNASLRQLGDSLFVVCCVLKNAQTIEAIKGISENIANGYSGETLSSWLMELTCRFNVLVYILDIFFCELILNSDLNPEPSFGRVLENGDEKNVFMGSISRISQLQGERVLNPIQNIENYFSEPAHFVAEFVAELGLTCEEYQQLPRSMYMLIDKMRARLLFDYS